MVIDMPSLERIQKSRSSVIKELDKLIDIAYSELPANEYEALRVVKAFIKIKMLNDLNSSGCEDT